MKHNQDKYKQFAAVACFASVVFLLKQVVVRLAIKQDIELLH